MIPGSFRRGYGAILVALAGLLLASVPAAAQDAGGIAIGEAAPVIRAVDVSGKPVSVTVAGSGPTLIEFWATWCPYCARLEPKLKVLHARYGKRVRFVAVAVNVNESLQRVARYSAGHALPYVVVYDASGAASREYDAPATSFIVVADAGGRVTYTGLGDGQDLQAALDRVLRIASNGERR